MRSLKFISYVRRFLDGRGYMEVEPRCSTPSPAAPRPAPRHHHNTLDIAMYMRIATERT